MGGINRIPKGYLDLVGTETGGRTPSNALESVTPVVNLQPFYEGQAMAQSLVNTVSLRNSVAVHTVPDDEVWFVYNCAATMTVGTLVGDGFQFALAFSRLPRGTQNAVTWVHGFERKVGVAAGDGQIVGHTFPVPVPLQGGSEIRFQSFQAIGVSRAVATYVFYSLYTG